MSMGRARGEHERIHGIGLPSANGVRVAAHGGYSSGHPHYRTYYPFDQGAGAFAAVDLIRLWQMKQQARAYGHMVVSKSCRRFVRRIRGPRNLHHWCEKRAKMWGRLRLAAAFGENCNH